MLKNRSNVGKDDTKNTNNNYTPNHVVILPSSVLWDKDDDDVERYMTIEELENIARETALQNPFLLSYLGNLAAVKVLILYLMTVETVFACLLTVALTNYWYFAYRNNTSEPVWNGNSLNFILVTFAVVSPLTGALGMAFSRRERALIAMASFRTFTYHLYSAHCVWDWPNDASGGRHQAALKMIQKYRTGKKTGNINKKTTSYKSISSNVPFYDIKKDDTDDDEEILVDNFWLEHCDAVLAQIIGIGDELSRFLTLPAMSRSRHRLTKQGRKEAARTIRVAYHLLDSITTQRLTRLTMYTERLKMIGLPSSEISRVHQYERYLSETVEQLRMIKMYRTPQVFRSFARIFTIVLPPFYAPAFAQVAIEIQSLGVGIAFGILTVLALSGLFESLQILEDPFTSYITLDGVNVREELEVLNFSQLINTRTLVFPNAPIYPLTRRGAIRSKSFRPVPDNKAHGKDTAVSGPSSSRSDTTHHHNNVTPHKYVGIPPLQSHHHMLRHTSTSSMRTLNHDNREAISKTATTDAMKSDVTSNQTHPTSLSDAPTRSDDTALQDYGSVTDDTNISEHEDLELGTALRSDINSYTRDTSYSPSNDAGFSERTFWSNTGTSSPISVHGALSRRHIRSPSAG